MSFHVHLLDQLAPGGGGAPHHRGCWLWKIEAFNATKKMLILTESLTMEINKQRCKLLIKTEILMTVSEQ